MPFVKVSHFSFEIFKLFSGFFYNHVIILAIIKNMKVFLEIQIEKIFLARFINCLTSFGLVHHYFILVILQSVFPE